MSGSADPLTSAGVAYVLDDFPIPSEKFIERELIAMTRVGIATRLCVARHRTAGDWVGAPRRLFRSGSRRRLAALVRETARSERRGGIDAVRAAVTAAAHARALDERPPALVHAHFGSVPAIWARYLGFLLGRPWGVSVHARDIYGETPARFSARLAGASYVVTCSDAAARFVRGRVPTATPVTVVHHGLDLDEWRPRASAPAPGQPRVLALGRLIEKKNFEALVVACARLKSRYPNLRGYLAGEGPMRQDLERLIERTGAPMTLLPWQGEAAVKALYREATILVAPGVVAADGDRDNISNVIVEAMAMGVPVLSCEVSRNALGADDSRSILVADPTPEALVAALDGALSNPERLASLCLAGRSLVERRFDLHRNVDDLVSVFRTAIRGPA